MLNRTLNGIHLGTRTLAGTTLAGLNIVATQRLRHDHPQKRKDSMRDVGVKRMGDRSISDFDSISRISPGSPAPSSPLGSSFRPYRGRPASPARVEVVVTVPVECLEAALLAARAPRAAWPQSQAWPLVQAGQALGTTMTQAEPIPAATFAAGG